ncbi:MerR family transcriptional regulator [Clavibacter capsici]|uniref:MerR family transcriptional regulator n=1 Tax=Clavibacter capsici TaxID=1874630 RepID=A0AAE7CBR0_9MICO|nr:MerR family transcriptional regulator [Clavibacter capsici]ALD11823.1 MerR family transcriptional regulator [Clavibacter capsici]QIS43890.1 MerR family transcriptional regulator [Clavibacter capsici]
MHPSLIPPRSVKIGDAAAFAGTTPRAIRHYHRIGLLPEPERGADDRRRYGHDDMMRLLWILRTVDAGIALGDIREALLDTGPAEAGAGSGDAKAAADTDARPDADAMLERLEASLAEREAEIGRQRLAVQRMRARGARLGLLSDFVARRLEGLPTGSVRPADLDALLVMERMFGPLGAAVHASRAIALATHPELRAQADRVDASEEALDDSVAVDDPRVAEVAAERHAFERALDVAIRESGQHQDDDALFDEWERLHPDGADGSEDEPGAGPTRGHGSLTAAQALTRMPYDLSPARLRCQELLVEMGVFDLADAEERR